MDTAPSPRRPVRQVNALLRPGRILLAAACLTTALLASACDTAQQVPWATYSSQLQQQIDAATATGNCAALRVYLAAAQATSSVHEKATGFPQRRSRGIHPGRPAHRRLSGENRLTEGEHP